ncbi:crotonase/enoyl-CoA hydratase family protein [Sphingomonas oligophenolica]|uniref:Crotonase/enoyl-CoA hydratase family protein n=1 Tax=Sphingomonas oligophenolica TaxID=301154 RepID=A0ABU9Y6D8_9SPHN
MSDQPLVLIDDLGDGIRVVTMNRPDVRNAISDNPMIDALIAAAATLDADPAVRVLILTGAGSAFSAGGNLKTIAAAGGLVSDFPPQTRENYRAGIQRLPLAFERIDVPVIAAVNGPAIGAGCDLACMCDIRIAAQSAVFAESFVTLGLIPGDGGAWLLPRIVGFAKASEMVLTGERIDADDALAAGLVSRVVPDGRLIDAAVDIARKIAANPRIAVRMTRRLMRVAQNERLENTLEYSAALQALAHMTEDHREALRAFGERRRPVFQGG